MDFSKIESALRETLADRTLSRGEKRALKAVFEDEIRSAEDARRVRDLALRLATEAVSGSPAEPAVEWLGDVVRALPAEGGRPATQLVEFGPGPGCTERINGSIRTALERLDICVFTITDDRISAEIRAAHARGVRVRIISDDDKAQDLGADVHAFERAGIPVVLDSTGHMHHKFAVVDGRRLLTGSFNWTRSAATENHENLLLSDDPLLVAAFVEEFERLWTRFGGASGAR